MVEIPEGPTPTAGAKIAGGQAKVKDNLNEPAAHEADEVRSGELVESRQALRGFQTRPRRGTVLMR